MAKIKNFFGKTMTRVLEDKNLKPTDKLIYFALVSFNGAGYIHPSLQTIAKRLNMKSTGAISRGLNRLQREEYISIQRRKHQTNIYQLVEKSIVSEKPKCHDLPVEANLDELFDKIGIQDPETRQSAKERIEKGLITIKEFEKLNSTEYENKSWRDVSANILSELRGIEKSENADYSFLGGLLKHKQNDKISERTKFLMAIITINKHSDKIKSEGMSEDTRKYIHQSYKNFFHTDYKNLFNTRSINEFESIHQNAKY
ncbi:MAG TPA: helix-turn-helix domain-containing protein [Ignavibacteria bacterium]